MLCPRRTGNRARHAKRAGILSGHPIGDRDPGLTASLAFALSNHLAPRTHSGYDSAAGSYGRFCDDRGFTPYPVDPVLLAAFVIYESRWVSVASIQSYMSAVRSAHLDHGFEWTLEGNATVHRAS
jgi:hypothetical protein